MTKPSSFRRRTMIIAGALAFAAVTMPQSARARDKEFGTLVHYVESHYHAHRQYRFLIGFASMAVNIAHPYGVKGMKLALWEDAKIKANGDADDFPAVVRAGLAEDWQPMVRVWSRHAGERTVVFAKPDGNEMKLLVATIDQEDAVVVQVKINPDNLSKYIDDWTTRCRHDRRGDRFDAAPPPPEAPHAEAIEVASGR
jgi:hypothetical protein